MTTEQTPDPWTEEEARAFTETLTTFRDSLPPRQREAFTAIIAAAAAAEDQDVHGYFFGGAYNVPSKMASWQDNWRINERGGLSPAQGTAYGWKDLAADVGRTVPPR